MEHLKKVKKFDLLAQKVTLNVEGKNGLRTYFGAFLTFSYFVTVITFAILFFMSFLDTTEPLVGQQTEEMQEGPYIEVGKDDIIPILFGLYKEQTFLEPQEVYRYVTPVLIKLVYSTNFDSNAQELDRKITNIKIIPCKQLRPEQQALYKAYNTTDRYLKYQPKGLCLDLNPEDLDQLATGTITKNDKTEVHTLMLHMFPCSLPVGCHPTTQLSDLMFTVGLPSVSVNYSDYRNPLSTKMNMETYYTLNPTIRQVLNVKISSHVINDDRGTFFEKIQRTNHSLIENIHPENRLRNPTQVKCTLAEIQQNQCGPYLSFMFLSSTRRSTVTRVYKNLSAVMSQIGGINNICLLIFIYLNGFYVSRAKRDYLVGKVFGFLSKNQELLAKRRKEKAKIGTEAEEDKRPVERADQKEALWNITDPAKLKKLRAEAYKIVENNLDIVTIVKELSALKFLTKLLLEERHRSLLPLVSLNVQLEKSRKLSVSSSLRSKWSLKGKEEEEAALEKRAYNQASDELQESIRQMEIEAVQNYTLENKLDHFCYESLSKAGDIPLAPGLKPVEVKFLPRRSVELSARNRPLLGDAKPKQRDVTILKPKLKGNQAQKVQSRAFENDEEEQATGKAKSNVNFFEKQNTKDLGTKHQDWLASEKEPVLLLPANNFLNPGGHRPSFEEGSNLENSKKAKLVKRPKLTPSKNKTKKHQSERRMKSQQRSSNDMSHANPNQIMPLD